MTTQSLSRTEISSENAVLMMTAEEDNSNWDANADATAIARWKERGESWKLAIIIIIILSRGS